MYNPTSDGGGDLKVIGVIDNLCGLILLERSD